MSSPQDQHLQQEPLATIDGNVPKQIDPFNTANPVKKPSNGAGGLLYPKKMAKDQASGPYVSPSDNIVSPASAKLNAFKEKRFAKSGSSIGSKKLDKHTDAPVRSAKPRTLFANTKTITNDSAFSPKASKLKVAADKAEDQS